MHTVTQFPYTHNTKVLAAAPPNDHLTNAKGNAYIDPHSSSIQFTPKVQIENGQQITSIHPPVQDGYIRTSHSEDRPATQRAIVDAQQFDSVAESLAHLRVEMPRSAPVARNGGVETHRPTRSAEIPQRHIEDAARRRSYPVLSHALNGARQVAYYVPIPPNDSDRPRSYVPRREWKSENGFGLGISLPASNAADIARNTGGTTSPVRPDQFFSRPNSADVREPSLNEDWHDSAGYATSYKTDDSEVHFSNFSGEQFVAVTERPTSEDKPGRTMTDYDRDHSLDGRVQDTQSQSISPHHDIEHRDTTLNREYNDVRNNQLQHRQIPWSPHQDWSPLITTVYTVIAMIAVIAPAVTAAIAGIAMVRAAMFDSNVYKLLLGVSVVEVCLYAIFPVIYRKYRTALSWLCCVQIILATVNAVTVALQIWLRGAQVVDLLGLSKVIDGFAWISFVASILVLIGERVLSRKPEMSYLDQARSMGDNQ